MLPAVLPCYYAVTVGGYSLEALRKRQGFLDIRMPDEQLILNYANLDASGAISFHCVLVKIRRPLDEVFTPDSAVHVAAIFYAVLVPLVGDLDLHGDFWGLCFDAGL